MIAGDAGRARLALHLGDDALQEGVHPAGGDLAEVVEHLLGGGLAEQAEDRDQHQHRREHGEHAEIGQRGGAVGDVVVLELADRALQDGEPSGLGHVGERLRRARVSRGRMERQRRACHRGRCERAIIASVRRPVRAQPPTPRQQFKLVTAIPHDAVPEAGTANDAGRASCRSCPPFASRPGSRSPSGGHEQLPSTPKDFQR